MRLHPLLHQPRAIWGPPGNVSSLERWAMSWRTTHPGRGAGGTIIVCGLNPSTAWAAGGVGELDPTLTRIHRRAFNNGWQQVCMINLYPLRHTDPLALWAALPADFDSYGCIERMCQTVTELDLPEPWTVVAAWGATAPSSTGYMGGWVNAWCAQHHARHTSRCAEYLRALGGGSLWCWGTTKAGHPRHPLYLPAATPLQRWGGP